VAIGTRVDWRTSSIAGTFSGGTGSSQKYGLNSSTALMYWIAIAGWVRRWKSTMVSILSPMALAQLAEHMGEMFHGRRLAAEEKPSLPCQVFGCECQIVTVILQLCNKDYLSGRW
jgi:hypothetical protein